MYRYEISTVYVSNSLDVACKLLVRIFGINLNISIYGIWEMYSNLTEIILKTPERAVYTYDTIKLTLSVVWSIIVSE